MLSTDIVILVKRLLLPSDAQGSAFHWMWTPVLVLQDPKIHLQGNIMKQLFSHILSGEGGYILRISTKCHLIVKSVT